MSRIGKKPITLPEKVTVAVGDNMVVVAGPKGKLVWRLPQDIMVSRAGNNLRVATKGAKNRAVWGTARSVLANMVKGVVEGYEKRLEIEGIGFKAQAEGDSLTLNVGFSHPVEFKAPPGISLKVEKNVILVSGADKALVGEVAANIRKIKKPEPYKGKGIHYLGEVIRRKVGKRATAGA